MSTVGKNIPHDSAKGHVSGESLYVDDNPFTGNELFVDFYGSPVAHGILKSIDLEKARAIPSVVGLYTHEDLDGHNCFGPIIQDEPLLVEDTVMFVGHPIVVIAAESRDALKQAKKAIDVTIDPLPPVFTIDEAIAKRQFISDTKTIASGDAETAMAKADHVLEGTFCSAGQEHFYLESQACIAYPGEHNTMTVLSSTQHPSEVQAVIAEVLGFGFHQVVCETKRMGGGFGGKESQATHPAVMAALVAHKTKRAARICLTVDDDMKTTGKRHPFQSHYKIGFTNKGKITALQIHLYSDGGAFADLSTAVMGRAMCHAENAYYIPNTHIQGTICRTNTPPNTAFRGFGGPQGMACIESIVEDIAQYLQMDAYAIRTLNCYGVDERNTTPYGATVQNNWLPEIFERLAKETDYNKRLKAVTEFNQNSLTHLRGISMTPIKFGISFNTKFLNQANALVNIYLDGTVQVSTGATEMGQGVNTKIQQLVADELHIPTVDVRVMKTSTEKSNNTSATAASSASDLNGSAAVNACEQLKERLLTCMSQHLAPEGQAANTDHIVWDDNGFRDARQPDAVLSFKEAINRAYLDRVNLGARGFFATQGIHFDWATGKGNPFLYYTTGCALSEVQVDRFTGEVDVLQTDILMDIGKPINPGIDRGQITGAFIQGMGWVTTEDLRYDDDGNLLSHSPTTYKIPNIQDVPQVFNVNWVDNPDNIVNLRQSKAVGEPPFMLALSVWAAIKHALSYTANDAIVELNLPATHEEIVSRLAHYTSHSSTQQLSHTKVNERV